MKPLRACSWPPTSLLEQGSHDDYIFLQASPSPKYSVISCLFPISRTESFTSFFPLFSGIILGPTG